MCACSERQPSANTHTVSADTVATVHTDTSKQKDNLVSADTFSIPTKLFVDIVSIFDSAGFKADTNRIKKVPYYSWTVKSSQIFSIHSIPFYKMDKETNPVFSYLKRHSQDTFNYPRHSTNYWEDSISKMSIKKGIFKKVNTITGFYFTEKIPSGLQTDGFIEEWVFPTVTDAQTAETTLTKRDNSSSPIYYFIYFNSFSQVFRKENHLYIYYSRADWDGRLLEKLYEQVIKKINADTWTKVVEQY